MTKDNLHWDRGLVTYQDRCRNLNQRGLVLWFTGLSGAGKSTIAAAVEAELLAQGRAVYRLDGDNIRLGLNADLGFSEADRNENIRRIAEVAALFKDAGLIVLVCAISPYRKLRRFAREKAGAGSFIEIFVKADLDTCKKRDPKGLYQQAERREVADFTGISAPYEEPEAPELVIDTARLDPAEAAAAVLAAIRPLI